MNNVIDNVSEILKLTNDTVAGYNKLIEEQDKVNDEICDLEHIIELERFDAYRGYLYAKQLKDLRCQRRTIKNQIEQCSSIISYYKAAINTLHNQVDQLRRIEVKQKNAYYNFRILRQGRIEHVNGEAAASIGKTAAKFNPLKIGDGGKQNG